MADDFLDEHGFIDPDKFISIHGPKKANGGGGNGMIPPTDEQRFIQSLLDGVIVKAPPFEMEWLDNAQPVLDSKDFVQGLFVEKSAAVLYGESNCGKTFLAVDLALHIAAGMPWNGRRVKQGFVIYCSLEGSHSFRNRLAAWKAQHKPPRNVPFAFIDVSLNLRDHNGTDAQRLVTSVELAQRAIGEQPILIVIDTLSRALHGGDENSPDDMGALVAQMDFIRTQTGAAVLFIHHSGKDASKGARGHSLLRAAVDTEIEVKSDETTGEKSATIAKQRDLAKGDVIGFRLNVHKLGENEHGEPVTSCTVETMGTLDRSKPVKKLTEEERNWLNDLAGIFAADGTPERRFLASRDRLSLSRDDIRDGLVKRGRLSRDSAGNVDAASRQSLSRYLNRLRDKGKIGMEHEFVWLENPRDTLVTPA